MSKLRRRDVLDAVRIAMTDVGFETVGGNDVYARPIGDQVLGWVGLTTEVEGGVVEIAPKVGVRHERVHEIVDALRNRSSDGTPTVSTLLGYLMPQKSANVVWRFDDQDNFERQARDLVDAIETHGRPYIDANVDLETVVETLRGAVPWEYSQVRIPVALALLGRDDEARSFITDELANLGDREDPAAEAFRDFARAFGSAPTAGS